MKIRQNVRHWAFKKALTTPVVGDVARSKLAGLHVDIFGERAAEGRRAEREAHMEGFFENSFDAYVAALEAGFTEAEAREVTHLQANFDFYNHGWTEMMEIPVEELAEQYDRYGEFFAAHDVTIDDPLGEFTRVDVPEAPSTPERLADPVHPHAEGGFADDVYVEGSDGRVVKGTDAETYDDDEVDVAAAPGLSGVDAETDADAAGDEEAGAD
jgi:PAS domain-containing protein